MQLAQFKTEATEFIARLTAHIENQNLVLADHWPIDHLCYRSANLESYTRLRQAFMGFADLLIESEVNGRPISTFKLREPLLIMDRRCDVVELPAPKPGRVTRDGFEHIEVVCDLPFDQLQSFFPSTKFNTTGLKKSWNAELEIEFGDCALKFHYLSLESVVTLEKNGRAFGALKASRALEIFHAFSPLVAGTFPLGLEVTDSDLDILLYAQDLSQLAVLIKEQFALEKDFQISESEVQGRLSLTAGFIFQGVPFEIFAQGVPTVNQRAYVHFQIEERLLALGGAAFRAKIQALRQTGLKTEPAFARALNLIGDPYEELLELHEQPEYVLASQFN